MGPSPGPRPRREYLRVDDAPTGPSHSMRTNRSERHRRRERMVVASPGRSRRDHHLFVARATVERLIRSGGRPSGRAVDASEDRPSGILVLEPAQLRGLLMPGDVITQVQGRSVRSVEDLVLAVGDAQKAAARVVTGAFWRRGELWSVAVAAPW